ncbi:MAG: DUF460 domain-containing protein [Candidatus Aenigmatarchaeota archaeon]
MQTPIIVGLDPGITFGLAVLDTDRKLISLLSRRDMQRKDIINEIDLVGRPIIIACDVNPAPDSVDKIAATFGSKLFIPDTDLSVDEKVELTREFEIKDKHQQDALASAIKAYRTYSKVIERVKKRLEETGQTEMFPEVVIRMLREGNESIADTISKILNERKKPVEEKVEVKKIMTSQELQNLVDKLQRRIAQKDSALVMMKQHSESLIKEMEELKAEMKNFNQTKIVDKEIDKLWHRISILEKEAEELNHTNNLLKKMRRVEDEGFIPLVEVEKVSGDELFHLNKKIDLKNRVVFTNSTENLDLLNEYEIKALIRITPLGEKEIEKLEFPVIAVSEDFIGKSDQIKVIKEGVFEKELQSARKTGLVGWIKRYRERKS